MASAYSHVTQKGSVKASGSESSSEADTESQAGSDSGGKGGEGSGSKEGEGSHGKGESEDGDPQQGDSGNEVVEVSCSKAEKSGSESGSSS